MTSAHGPQSPSFPPWLTVSAEPASASASTAASATTPETVVIDGRACRTRAAFFTEVARVLRLPGYFGHNWDALTDAFRDLLGSPADHGGRTKQGRPGHSARLSLVVAHAEELLSAEPPGQFATLLSVLTTAATEATEASEASEAAEPGAPLTVTLCTDPDHEAGLRLRVAAALP